jgi:hypothetical protein
MGEIASNPISKSVSSSDVDKEPNPSKHVETERFNVEVNIPLVSEELALSFY